MNALREGGHRGKAARFGIALSISANLAAAGFLVWVVLGSPLATMIRLGMASGFERRTSQFEALGIGPDDTVFLGDSLTEFGEWNELFPNGDVRNRGIDGDQTSGVLSRLEQITKGTPRQVFLLIGTNDLTAGVSETQIVRNVVEIVETIGADSPRTEVFVQSVLPRSEEFGDRVQSLNAALRDAVEQRAVWIDLYPLFLDDTGMSIDDALSNDELHLLGPGYLIWKKAIVDLVPVTG